MKEVIRNELGVFDYRDYIFDDDPSVYILVKDLSVYDTDHTIVYRSFPDDADGYFNGTVIFTKMDDFGFAPLSGTTSRKSTSQTEISLLIQLLFT